MSQERLENKNQAFTLIEMMVVVALIGILIAGVFRLMGTAAENTKRAETMERLQRLENALSGFYAEYGSYPPVPRQGSPDPFVSVNSNGSTTPTSSLSYKDAIRASRSQPVSFEFPTPSVMDDYILAKYKVYSANVNVSAFDENEVDWDKCKLFRYGVMSFLVPRLEAMGFQKLGRSGSSFTFDEYVANQGFFSRDRKQWSHFNEGYAENYSTLQKQYDREMKSCARWMPNLQNAVAGGIVFNGISTKKDPSSKQKKGYEGLSGLGDDGDDDNIYTQSSGNRHALGCMTILDGWENELYYYSAPPYQSYRIWSAGPNGKTFPPWIPLQSLSSEDRKTVNEWIQDDIARFDR